MSLFDGFEARKAKREQEEASSLKDRETERLDRISRKEMARPAYTDTPRIQDVTLPFDNQGRLVANIPRHNKEHVPTPRDRQNESYVISGVRLTHTGHTIAAAYADGAGARIRDARQALQVMFDHAAEQAKPEPSRRDASSASKGKKA